MDINFDGDIADFRAPAQELCRNILTEKGYTNCTVQVEAVGQKGDNYVANVKRLSVQQDDVNNGEPFKMIVKLAPNNEQLREMMNTAIAFTNEIIIYKELFPKFEELQDEAGIPKYERLIYPTCYGTINDIPEETMFLQDIKELGFVMLDRFVSLTDEQIKLALKELAKFHSLSYVLNIKEPKTFDCYKNKLINIWAMNTNTKEMDEFIASIANDVDEIIENEEYKKRIKRILNSMGRTSLNLHKAELNSKHAVIIQGDCWTNNMMFKLEVCIVIFSNLIFL